MNIPYLRRFLIEDIISRRRGTSYKNCHEHTDAQVFDDPKKGDYKQICGLRHKQIYLDRAVVPAKYIFGPLGRKFIYITIFVSAILVSSTQRSGVVEDVAVTQGEIYGPPVRLATLQTDFKTNTQINVQPKNCTHICGAALQG